MSCMRAIYLTIFGLLVILSAGRVHGQLVNAHYTGEGEANEALVEPFNDSSFWVDDNGNPLGSVPLDQGQIEYHAILANGKRVPFRLEGAASLQGRVTSLTLGSTNALVLRAGDEFTVELPVDVDGLVEVDGSGGLFESLGTGSGFNDARLAARGGGAIRLASSGYVLSGRRDGSFTFFGASGAGSSLDLSSMGSLRVDSNHRFGSSNYSVSASGGGSIDLSGLTAITGAPEGDDRLRLHLASDGGGLDLSSLVQVTRHTLFNIGRDYTLPVLLSTSDTRFQPGDGVTLELPELQSFHSDTVVPGAGATLNAPKLSTFTDSDLTISPSWTLNAPDFTEADNSRIHVRGGSSYRVADAAYVLGGRRDGSFTFFSAADAGSSLDLSAMGSLQVDSNHRFGSSNYSVSASGGGSIDLSGLAAIVGAPEGDDRLRLHLASDGGGLDLSSLMRVTRHTLFDIDAQLYTLPALESVSDTRLEPGDFVTLNLPRLTSFHSDTIAPGTAATVNALKLSSFTDSDLTISPSWTLNAPDFTEVDNSRIHVRNGSSYRVADTAYVLGGRRDGSLTFFSAADAGSSLDLSSLQSVRVDSNHRFGSSNYSVSASGGGSIDLTGLAVAIGAPETDDFLQFVADGGDIQLGNLDASRRTRFVVSAPGSQITANALILRSGSNLQVKLSGAARFGQRLELADNDTWVTLNTENQGSVTIGSGALETTPATLRVRSNGELAGVGTINGDVANDGLVVPGASNGTLTISGDYAQGSNATLEVSIGGGGSDLLAVGGGVVLGGTLTVVTNGAYDIGEEFEVITGAVTGTFASSNAALLGLVIDYQPDKVVLRVDNDSDGDGLPDAWELVRFGDLTRDGTADEDGDGLDDAGELAQGTDPNESDSDGDGLDDGDEVANHNTSPSAADTDGDGLSDGDEVNTHGSDPLVADSDGDRLPDGDEVNNGTDPTLADTDGDGENDGKEVALGSDPNDANSTPNVQLLAYWNFNDTDDLEVALDATNSIPGTVNNATYGASGSGQSGQSGDHSMDFSGAASILVENAGFMNQAAASDTITVVFWQKLTSLTRSSSFWVVANSNDRAFQAHVPWTDNRIYFDTTGCCDESAQRISGNSPVDTTDGWHHFAFVKDRERKSVWVDGVLAFEGVNTLALPQDIVRLWIGSGNGNSSIDGEIDDVAVFGTALSGANIAKLADRSVPTPLALVPDPDSDGDGLLDEFELAFFGDLSEMADGDPDGDGLNNESEASQGTDPTIADSDNDGLADGAEVASHGTDPLEPDSDFDGFTDGEEIAAATAPNDVADFPPLIPVIGAIYTGLNPGIYNDSENWDVNSVPLDSAGVRYFATIGSGTVNLSAEGSPLTGTLTGLTVGSGGNLRLATNDQLTVELPVDVDGLVEVDGSGGLFESLGTGSGFNDARLAVRGGGAIRLASSGYVLSGRRDGSFTFFGASGAGSSLDLSSMGSLRVDSNHRFGSSNYSVSASGGGSIDLSGLTSITGAPENDDRLRLHLASDGGGLDLSSLVQVTRHTLFNIGRDYTLPVLLSTSDTRFQPGDGVTLELPELQSFHSDTVVPGAGATLNAPKLSTFTDSDLTISPSWTLNAPDFTEADNSRIHVRGGSSYRVADAAYVLGGRRDGSFTFFSAADAGSSLDLSAMGSLQVDSNHRFGSSNYSVSASGGGSIDLSGLAAIVGAPEGDDRLRLHLASDGGGLDLSSLMRVTRHTLFDIDAQLYTLPALESVSDTRLEPGDFVTLNLPRLTSFHSDTIAPGTAATVNALKLSSFTDSDLTISPSWTLNAPDFTEVDNSRIHVRNGSSYRVADTAYVLGGRRDGSLTFFSAADAGSSLDLSSLQSVRVDSNHRFGSSNYSVSASGGGSIDLSGLTAIVGAPESDDFLQFVANGGSIQLGNLNASRQVSMLVEPSSSITGLDASFEGAGELRISGNGALLSFAKLSLNESTQLNVQLSGTAHVLLQLHLSGTTVSLTSNGGGSLVIGGGDPDPLNPLPVGTAEIKAGGALTGVGRIVGSLANGGLVEPGFSHGAIEVTENYTQTGTLDVSVGGGNDLLAVSGEAQLGGTLSVTPIGPYSSGDEFEIIQAGEVVGTFSSSNAALLGLVIDYQPDKVVLRVDNDSDGDGLPDVWETAHFGSLEESGDSDTDEDGLDNAGELANATDPNETDTDSDGLSDGDEINSHITLPLVADTDGDGLSDGDEVNVHGSLPTEVDTDGDRLADGDEINAHGTNPAKPDSDDDLVDDPIEVLAGSDPTDENSLPASWTVRHIQANTPLNDLANLSAALSDPTLVTSESTTEHITINFRDNSEGRFLDGNEPFPLFGDFGDRSDFGIRATGKIFVSRPGLRTFGVNSDDGFRLIIDGRIVSQFNSTRGSTDTFGTVELSEGFHDVELEFFERRGGAQVELFSALQDGEFSSFDQATFVLLAPLESAREEIEGDGLFATYFSEPDFTGNTVRRVDPEINFVWGSEGPDAFIGTDSFSARWEGDVLPRVTDDYLFHVTSDEAVRVWLDLSGDGEFQEEELVVNDWEPHSQREATSSAVSLAAGQRYRILVEYFEISGDARIQLLWSASTIEKQAVPTAQLVSGEQYSVTVATPQISPPSGTYGSPLLVRMAVDTADAEIRYTLDGTEPSRASNLYESAFPLSTDSTLDVTVLAKAFKDDTNDSGIVSVLYSLDSLGPDLDDLTFDGSPLEPNQEISRSGLLGISASDGSGVDRVEFAYIPEGGVNETLIGADDTPPFQAPWNVSLLPDGEHRVKVSAFDSFGVVSSISIPVSLALDAPVSPLIQTPQPGFIAFSNPVRVSGIAWPYADLAVTVNDEAPVHVPLDSVGNFFFDVELRPGANTISAVSTNRAGASNATLIAGQLIGGVGRPDATPPPGSYQNFVDISLASSSTGAVILYTLDGSDPSDSPSALIYSTPFRLTSSATVKARAVNGPDLSELFEGTYTVISSAPQLRDFAFESESLVDGTVISRTGQLTVNATDETGVRWVDFVFSPIDGSAPVLAGRDSDGVEESYSSTWIVSGLTDGEYIVSAVATDLTGNTSSLPVSVTVALETPPAPVITAPADGVTTDLGTTTVRGQAWPHATLQILRNGQVVKSSVGVDSSGAFVTQLDLEAGDNLLVARSTNRAGTSEDSNSIQVTYSTVPPTLTLELENSDVGEGGSVRGVLKRQPITGEAVTIALSTTAAGRLQVPGSLTIAPNSESVQIEFFALDNDLIELPQDIPVIASAGGFRGASTNLTVLDDDQPTVEMKITPAEVSESVGAQTVMGEVTLSEPTEIPLSFALTTNIPEQIVMPEGVTFDTRSTTAVFPIAVTDNELSDGERELSIDLFLLDSDQRDVVARSATGTLRLFDDDGPALILSVDKSLVAEGLSPALDITVTRRGSNENPLTVNLATSGTALVVPPTVTIPTGADFTTFSASTPVSDGEDGNRDVTLSATADAYAPASLGVVVTDQLEPDLRIAEITAPAGVETDAFVDVKFVLENQGLAPAEGPFSQRLQLSEDTIAGDDLLLGQYEFGGTLNNGGRIEQTVRVRMPREAGEYTFVGVTDALNQVDEILESNNATVADRSTISEAAYSAMVTGDLANAPAGKPIPLEGSATLTSSGEPAPFVLVNIHARARGATRIFSALTNSNGEFATVFTPLPNESGIFEFGAAHPGTDDAPTQYQVQVFGLVAEPSALSLTFGATKSIMDQVSLINRADFALTGLQAELIGLPPSVTGEIILTETEIPVGGRIFATIDVSSDEEQEGTSATIRITSEEGAVFELPVAISVQALRPRLVATPARLGAGMVRGDQHFVEFSIANEGSAPTGPVEISLPANLPWLSSATASPLAPIESGESSTITLQLLPPEDLPLTDFFGNLWLTDGGEGLSVPFSFRALSDATGDLIVNTEDEFTYFAEGNPPLAEVTVTVIDVLSGEIVDTMVTGETGEVRFSNLREGYYRLVGIADRHQKSTQTFLLEPGRENDVTLFLPRETVVYEWTVTPTEIEDRTRITITSRFETNVPVPVIVIEPVSIDWDELTFNNNRSEFTVTVVNHGLITAKDFSLRLPTHPRYFFSSSVERLGDIPAKSSIAVPIVVMENNGLASALLKTTRTSEKVFSFSEYDGTGQDSAAPPDQPVDSAERGLSVTRIEMGAPTSGGESTISLIGTGFDSATLVKLKAEDQEILPTWDHASSRRMDLTYDLSSVSPGDFQLIIDRYAAGGHFPPDHSDEASVTFDVVDSIEPPQVVSVLPWSPRPPGLTIDLKPVHDLSKDGIVEIEATVSNKGGTDITLPYLEIGGEHCKVSLHPTSAVKREGSLAIFVYGGRRRDVVGPGESVSFRFFCESGGVEATVFCSQASDDTPIDPDLMEHFLVNNLSPSIPDSRSFQTIGLDTLASLKRGLADYIEQGTGLDSIEGRGGVVEANEFVSQWLNWSNSGLTEEEPNLTVAALRAGSLEELEDLAELLVECYDLLKGWKGLGSLATFVPSCPEPPFWNDGSCSSASSQSAFEQCRFHRGRYSAAGIEFLKEDYLPCVFEQMDLLWGRQVVDAFRKFAFSSMGSRDQDDCDFPVITETYGPGDEVVVGNSVAYGFKNSPVTRKAVKEVLDLATPEILERLANGKACPDLPQYFSIEDLGLSEIVHRRALALLEYPAKIALPKNDAAGLLVGGVGCSRYGPDDRRFKGGFKVSLESSDACGGKKMIIETDLTLEVDDAVDFCPGVLGGFVAKYVTVPLQILEANDCATAVKVEVTSPTLPVRTEIPLACSCECCDMVIIGSYHYVCGRPVFRRAYSSILKDNEPCCNSPTSPVVGGSRSSRVSGNAGGQWYPVGAGGSPCNFIAQINEERVARDGDPRMLAQESGVCAQVVLQIDQDAVMARDAFDATLKITNNTSSSLTEMGVLLEVLDAEGNDVTDLFGIRDPILHDLNSLNGEGRLEGNGSGSATWLIIPTTGAAPLEPTRYLVGGTLFYHEEGLLVQAPLSEVEITVYPQAELDLKYFHQRDVFSDDPFTDPIEPAVPYSLAVLVKNKGAGEARNLRVTSAQPKIIENEKGLLIDFDIIATEVAGESLQPGLSADFGNVAPGETKIGRWLLTSTLQGLFVDYEATFEHIDGLGDPRLSLIKSVAIHEMNHLVEAQPPFDDGLPDFLVNDVEDENDYPDTLHLSDGSVAPVTVVEEAQILGDLGESSRSVSISAAMPAEWGYLRVAEPSDGAMRLMRVLRSDGVEIPLDTNAWVTDRTFVGMGLRPVYENILHIFDYGGTGVYTLFYDTRSPADSVPPTSAVVMLDAESTSQIPIMWKGEDSGGSIGFYDVFVSEDGGEFVPWLQQTRLTSAVFEGEQGREYSFYSVATDSSGNKEPKQPQAEAMTTVSLGNVPPVLEGISDQIVVEGESFSLPLMATDSDGSDEAITFEILGDVPPGLQITSDGRSIEWETAEDDGGTSIPVVIRATDSGLPTMTAMTSFNLSIEDENGSPLIQPVQPQRIQSGESFSLLVTGEDPDIPAQLLEYTLSEAPEGMEIDPNSGLITWTTNSFALGTHPVTAVVIDDGSPSLTAEIRFTVTVEESLFGDTAPSIAYLPPVLWLEGTENEIMIAASDGDGDLISIDAGLSQTLGGNLAFEDFGDGSARFLWNTTGVVEGTYLIPVTASANGKSSSSVLRIQIREQSPYWIWAVENLPSEGLADFKELEMEGDLDQDGTINVFEMALLRDPNRPDETILECVAEEVIDDKWVVLNICFHRRKGSGELVSIAPEYSSTMEEWELWRWDWEAFVDPDGDDDGNPDTEYVVIRIVSPRDGADGVFEHFYRLRLGQRPSALE